MSLNPNSPFFHEERYAPLALFSEKLICICGAGALGGTLTETLARMGMRNIRLIDRDRVEMRNLSTQPYNRAEVGVPKARALANSLYRAISARIEPVVSELTENNAAKLLQGSELVIDAFDNHAGRMAINKTALALKLPCLHIGFSGDGLYGSGEWEPGYQVPKESEGDPCDYPLTRPFAVMISTLAARVIFDFFRSGQNCNFECTWNDCKISFHQKNT